jgi:V/A-type H+-transporting ATPase subunit I
MALGVAGAMLAHVANTLGSTEGNVVLGILVALLLHLLHLVMSLFSPTIQALRLHYVEFFSKFYEPGGVPYAPFRK